MALYVHLPWCQSKCPYCDFNSHAAPDVLPQARYRDALVNDLRAEQRRARRAGVEIKELSSIFLGGGTPSLFDHESIGALLAAISRTIPLGAECEVTMEANPGALEVSRLPMFRRAGVNRVSLGIQSLNDKFLRVLGRKHSAREARIAIESALCSSFKSVNVDLMYGLPHQTVDGMLEDLAAVERYGLKHISWYELTIESNTVFGWRPPKGLPGEELSIAMRKEGIGYLRASGLDKYEVSAFARSPELHCRHNLNYWNYGDYIGIGAGAHGKLTLEDTGQVVRGHKIRSPLTYMRECLDRTTPPNHDKLSTLALEKFDLVEPEALADEFLINALRLAGGFGFRRWRECTHLDESLLVEAAAKLIDSDHIRISAEGLSLAPDSVGLLDEVIAQLCAEISALRGPPPKVSEQHPPHGSAPEAPVRIIKRR